MGLVHKYLSLSRRDKFLFLETLIVSLIVKLIVLMMPLRWYSRYLDRSGRSFTMKRDNNEETIGRITVAVGRCSRHAPWKTKCLVDAITAKLLLRWHKIDSTLYLGVHKDEGQKLVAHAWLKCDEKFITGRKGFQKFIVVSSFA